MKEAHIGPRRRRRHCSAECGRGWMSLYQPVLERAQQEHIFVTCIKEKFGQLYIYLDRARRSKASADLREMIHATYRASETTCETCGAPGLMREGAWMKVACDAHAGGRAPGRTYETLDVCCAKARTYI